MRFGRRATGFAAVLAVVAGAVVAVGPPAAAETPARFTVGLYGTGPARFWTEQTHEASVFPSWSAADRAETVEVRVAVKGGSQVADVRFSSPKGSNQRLAVGSYLYATAWPLSAAGRPGISAAVGCTDLRGSFQVRDIARRGAAITRLTLDYEVVCRGSSVGTAYVEAGEVRLGYPVGAVEIGPRTVRLPYPRVFPGQTTGSFPVLVRRTGPRAATVSRVAVVGQHAADFVVRRNECTTAVPVAGCRVWFAFTPKASGPRHAWLAVTTATTTAAGARTSSTTNVSLDGMGASGVSQWDVVENRSDPTAQDTSRSLRALTDGGPFDVRVEGVESGHLWNLSITDNQQPGLVRGRTYADDLNPSTPGVTLTYSRDGQGCEASSASVRVDDVAYEGPGKDLVRLDAQVSLACRSAQPYTVSLRVRERAGADVVPPPAVVGLRGSRVGDRVQVSWGRPAEAALGGYVVRWFAGTRAPLTPTTGTFGYGGTATSASFSAPARTPVALCVWAYDAAGNLGPRATLFLAPVG